MVAEGLGQRLMQAFTGSAGEGGINNVLDGITENLIGLGVIVQDVAEVVASQFQAMFSPALAFQLLLEGKIGQATETMKTAFTDAGKEILDLGSSFDRAGAEVEKFTQKRDALRKSLATGTAAPPPAAPKIEGRADENAEIKKGIDLLKLQNQVLAIEGKAKEDLLSDEEKIRKKYEQELKALDEIALKSEGRVDTERARIEVIDSMEREIHQRRLEEIEENQKALEDAAEETKKILQELAERRRQMIIATATTFQQSAGDLTDAMAQLGENLGGLSEKSAMRLFRIQKALGLAEVSIQGAVAFMRALAELGPIAGPIAAGVIAATTATQAAVIATTPPPKFDMGGMIGTRGSLAPDQATAQVLKGEAILDRQTVRNLGGEQGIRQIEGGGERVIVVQPWKHFDKFAATMRRRQRNLRPAQVF